MSFIIAAKIDENLQKSQYVDDYLRIINLTDSNRNHRNIERFYGFYLLNDGGFGFSSYFCSWNYKMKKDNGRNHQAQLCG